VDIERKDRSLEVMAQEADEYRKFVFWYFLSGARKDMKSYLISIKIILIIKEQSFGTFCIYKFSIVWKYVSSSRNW
jgi:hypothetical protein